MKDIQTNLEREKNNNMLITTKLIVTTKLYKTCQDENHQLSAEVLRNRDTKEKVQIELRLVQKERDAMRIILYQSKAHSGF
jgi:hypothetical protein